MPNPAPLKLTISNFFNIFNLFSPMLVIFIIIFIGFINQSYIQLLFYLGLLSFGTIIIRILQNFLNIEYVLADQDNIYCSFWDFPGTTQKFGFNMSNFILTFTFFYMLFAMVGGKIFNWGLFVLLLIFPIMNLINLLFRCRPSGSKMTGFLLFYTFLTTLFSVLITLPNIWISKSNPNLIFFSERESNNVICDKPSRQTFKCSVYKNGQLIKTL